MKYSLNYYTIEHHQIANFDKNIDFWKIAILSQKVEFLCQSKIRIICLRNKFFNLVQDINVLDLFRTCSGLKCLIISFDCIFPWINRRLWELMNSNLQSISEFFLFTLLLTPGAKLPVLGPFLAGGAFGSKTWRGPA